MTKNEALKKCIDGKKVSVNIFAVKWNGKYFSDDDGFEYCISKLPDIGWQIVHEYVDFAEAWKAYDEGKTIQAEDGYKYNKIQEKEYCYYMIQRKSIRGKWLILEDE